MKKLGVLLSLIFLMALSGCISEKTQQKLTTSTGGTTTSGGIEVNVGTDYSNKTVINTAQTTYEASYMKFKYPTDSNLEENTSGFINGIETITIKDKTEKATLISVTSYENKSVANLDEIKALATEKISNTSVVNESAKGKITFDLIGSGTYSLGTIVDGGVTYYYYVASVVKGLTKTGATESTNFTYVVKVIVKTNTNADLRNFEDIVRSLTSQEKIESNVDLKLVTEKAFLTSINSYDSYDMTDAGVRATIENKIMSIYEYVESDTDYVPSSIVGAEKRRSEAMKFINTWVIDGDGTIGTKIKTLLSRLEKAYRDKLEKEVASAEDALEADDLKVFKIPNADTIVSLIDKMIEKRVEQEVIAGYDFGQKINKDIAVENLRQKYTLFYTAIKILINHYAECVRVEGLGKNIFPPNELQGINYVLPMMEKVIYYQQYLKIDLDEINLMKNGGDSEIIAREYVRKEAIESLKISTEKIGYNKTSVSTYSANQSTVSAEFLEAIASVKAERLRNLNEEIKDLFIKLRTQESIDKIDMNDMVNTRNKIELTLFNMIKFVKFFDSSVTLEKNTYKTIDVIKNSIVNTGVFPAYKGTNTTINYIENAQDNYSAITVAWSNYYVHAADTILQYFDSSYTLD